MSITDDNGPRGIDAPPTEIVRCDRCKAVLRRGWSERWRDSEPAERICFTCDRAEKYGPREPKAVLLEMLKAYQSYWLSLVSAIAESGEDPRFSRRLEFVEGSIATIQRAYVAVMAEAELYIPATSLYEDYRARLRGERPLDAPPSPVE